MIVFPLSDDNDENHARHHHHFIHYGLIFICIAVSFYEIYLLIGGGIGRLENWVDHYAFDPRMLGSEFLPLSFPQRALKLASYLAHLGNFGLLRMIASTFIHGGLLHLFSNLFVLWMLGDNVEYAMGHVRYLLFFLLAGVASNFGETVFSTAANFVPLIGASGAIMAVAGAYMVYFPEARINFFYAIAIIWWGIYSVSARIVIGLYVLLQFAIAYFDYGTSYDHVGIWAHVTGFLFGVAMAWPLRQNRKERLVQPGGREAYRRSLRTAMRERQDRYRRKYGRL